MGLLQNRAVSAPLAWRPAVGTGALRCTASLWRLALRASFEIMDSWRHTARFANRTTGIMAVQSQSCQSCQSCRKNVRMHGVTLRGSSACERGQPPLPFRAVPASRDSGWDEGIMASHCANYQSRITNYQSPLGVLSVLGGSFVLWLCNA
jgi:hypothetical protein